MENIIAMIDVFHKGGVVMYLLLFMSVFIVALAVNRFLFFKNNDSGRSFTHEFYALMEQGDYAEAAALAKETKGATADIINRALMNGHIGHSSNLTVFLNIQSGIALAKFREYLYFLNVIVTAAPLLGLLGTILGMIGAFSILDSASGAIGITNGVGEALIATASGIFVALVALSVHSYFKQRLEGIITDMEQVFSELEAKRTAILKSGGANHEIA